MSESHSTTDPTQNVIALVDKETIRSNDLRVAYQLLTDEKINALQREAQIRSTYDRELREKEVDRIDAKLASITLTMDAMLKSWNMSMERLTDRVNAMLLDQRQNQGNTKGVKDMVGWLFGLAMLIIAALTLIFKK